MVHKVQLILLKPDLIESKDMLRGQRNHVTIATNPYAASRTLGENGSADASRADRTMPSNLRSSAVMLCS